MYDHLEPTNIPEPGPAELAAVKQRAAARQRNIFLLGASSGAGLVAIIALIVVALVSAGSNTKDVSTVGRPETTTTIAPALSTTVPPPGQPPAAAPGPATARRRGIRSTPAPAPSTTAHGSLVAFVAQNRSDEIDVVNLDGTARRTLWTHPIADHTSLTLGSWSPDGRLLAVTTHFAALGGGGSVYLIDPQGQVAGQIDDPNQDTVTWSPDGKELALGGGCSPCAIKVYDTHTFKQVRTVDKVQPAYLGFAWGPNARMASVQQSQTSGGLYTVAPDNTDPRPLVPGNVYSGYTHSLTTGPGNRVYYFDAKGLNVVRDDVGAIPVQIADTTAVGPVAPSPDGSLVAYKTGSSIAVVSSDGGSPNTLPTPGGCPAFAPDGRLLFSNSSGLWISDADGSNAKLIAAGGTCPTPSPA